MLVIISVSFDLCRYVPFHYSSRAKLKLWNEDLSDHPSLLFPAFSLEKIIPLLSVSFHTCEMEMIKFTSVSWHDYETRIS